MTHSIAKQENSYAIINVGQELNHGRRESANELRDMCKSLQEEGIFNFIFNFEKIKLCPSIVFGNLLVLGKNLAERDGRLYLACPSEHVEKAARITGLTATVALTRTIEEALAELDVNQ